MLIFNEVNVNVYLQSISNNQFAIQSFANDISNNFVNCFQTRFIMTQVDIDSLNSWPAVVRQQISIMAQTAATLQGIYGSSPLTWSIIGFENTSGVAATEAEADSVEVEIKVTTTTDTSTGHTDIKVEGKVTFAIC